MFSKNMTDTRAQEYDCPVCRTRHRSDEEKNTFEAHKYWQRHLVLTPIPERYYPNLDRLSR